MYIDEIVSYDESIMRKNLRHVGNSDGSIDVNIPEPVFLAEPSHRINVMTGLVLKTVSSTQDLRWCKRMDANHLIICKLLCISKHKLTNF